MDYKEKYEKALEIAKTALEQYKKPEYKDILPYAESDYKAMFPELSGSEDEKIREGIIRCVKGNMPDNDFRKKYLAWLEKQGEKVTAIEGFSTEFEKQVSYLIASAINKEHEYNEGFVKWIANALLEYAKHEFEKQGGQKPVEPKFRIGDKVKHGYLTYTVENIDEDSYKLQAYSKDGDKGRVVFLTIGHEDDYELVTD